MNSVLPEKYPRLGALIEEILRRYYREQEAKQCEQEPSPDYEDLFETLRLFVATSVADTRPEGFGANWRTPRFRPDQLIWRAA